MRATNLGGMQNSGRGYMGYAKLKGGGSRSHLETHFSPLLHSFNYLSHQNWAFFREGEGDKYPKFASLLYIKTINTQTHPK